MNRVKEVLHVLDMLFIPGVVDGSLPQAHLVWSNVISLRPTSRRNVNHCKLKVAVSLQTLVLYGSHIPYKWHKG